MKQVYHDPNKPEENQEESPLYSNTREDEKLKKTFKGEKEKLSQMNGKEKAEYITSYYKWPILAIIAVILIVIYLIYHAFTYTNPALYIDIVNSSIGNTDRQEEITDFIGMEKHERADLQVAVDSEADASAGSVYCQFDLYCIADEMDVIFADEAGAEKCCDYGFSYEIKDILPENLYSLWEDRIVTMSVYDVNTDDSYNDLPVAVDISGTNVQQYFGLTDDTCYLLVTNLSGHEEYLQKFFEMLYDIETGTIAVE